MYVTAKSAPVDRFRLGLRYQCNYQYLPNSTVDALQLPDGVEQTHVIA